MAHSQWHAKGCGCNRCFSRAVAKSAEVKREMYREQILNEPNKTMDVFEQLRWLAKDEGEAPGAGESRIRRSMIIAAYGLVDDWRGRHSFNESISNFGTTLVRLAGKYGGEKRALELKQMMEDTMGL